MLTAISSIYNVINNDRIKPPRSPSSQRNTRVVRSWRESWKTGRQHPDKVVFADVEFDHFGKGNYMKHYAIINWNRHIRVGIVSTVACRAT